MERRKDPRYEVQLSVSFSGDRAGSGTIQDLSDSGCLIVSPTKVEPGAHLSLWLALPRDPVPVLIEGAEVRWSAGERFGLCFQTLQPPVQIRLSQYLKR